MSAGTHTEPNESLHSRKWLHCLKHIRATKRKLNIVVAVATMEDNSGYVASNFHCCLGVPYTSILHKGLKKENRMDRQLIKKKKDEQMFLERTRLLASKFLLGWSAAS